ncbi:MAG TPA: hypothetical protein VFE17_01755 [Candidatus Baltobacteraceae bacterium]|nr:hypothetical protein [Candidatus Baltobacteraceae bacterium]
MKRVRIPAILWIALIVLAFSSANGAASGPVSLSALAPADEYFGHEKLSPLEIRHRIFSLKDDLHHARNRPDSIQHDASFVDDALHDWATRFPVDPWLPSTAWNLATLYEELPGTDAQQHAMATLQFVRTSFAGTPYAQLASRDLSRGVGVRPWPHWAGKPVEVASAKTTPTPSAKFTPSPVPTRSTPLPTLHSTPLPTHSATPAPAATATNADSLVAAILAQNKDVNAALAIESRFWTLSKNGSDSAYMRAAWQLAALYQSLPGDESRDHAIRLLALLVDRYPSAVYGRWALRDLARGVGTR